MFVALNVNTDTAEIYTPAALAEISSAVIVVRAIDVRIVDEKVIAFKNREYDCSRETRHAIFNTQNKK